MKFTLNEKRFGIVKRLVIAAVIIGLVFALMRIFAGNNIIERHSNFSYELPEDWIALECDTEFRKLDLLSPESDSAADCGDKTNVIALETDLKIDIGASERVCIEGQQKKDLLEDERWYSYECTIDEYKGKRVVIYETHTVLEKSRRYDFTSNYPVTVSYFANDKDEFAETSVFTKILDSLQFKQV